MDRGEGGRSGGPGEDWLVEGGGTLAPPDVDGVTAHFRGMLNIGDNTPDDWGILKDFLGFRLPHERDPESGVGVGEVTSGRAGRSPHVVGL